MIQKRTRRTSEEWMNLIQECRTSGLTDRQCCMEHNIQPSNFYYHICRFREFDKDEMIRILIQTNKEQECTIENLCNTYENFG